MSIEEDDFARLGLKSKNCQNVSETSVENFVDKANFHSGAYPCF